MMMRQSFELEVMSPEQVLKRVVDLASQTSEKLKLPSLNQIIQTLYSGRLPDPNLSIEQSILLFAKFNGKKLGEELSNSTGKTFPSVTFTKRDDQILIYFNVTIDFSGLLPLYDITLTHDGIKLKGEQHNDELGPCYLFKNCSPDAEYTLSIVMKRRFSPKVFSIVATPSERRATSKTS